MGILSIKFAATDDSSVDDGAGGALFLYGRKGMTGRVSGGGPVVSEGVADRHF